MTALSSLFACPICHGDLDALACRACGIAFAGDGVPNFICREMYDTDLAYETAARIIDFWGHGWRKRLQEPEHAHLLTRDATQLHRQAETSLAWHVATRSLMGEEVQAHDLSGKVVLNIGCGAGDEALVLGHRNARCIAMDITQPAAQSGDALLGAIGAGIGIQADARFIPLKDASVDVVYSSGVLHHSPDIAKSVREILRILKPGGIACVMLYATWSITFLQEKLLHRTGEAAWETGGRKNPLTTTYSVAQVRRLFAGFDSVSVDKRGGGMRDVAAVGKFLPSRLDGLVARSLGPNLNIVARKIA